MQDQKRPKSEWYKMVSMCPIFNQPIISSYFSLLISRYTKEYAQDVADGTTTHVLEENLDGKYFGLFNINSILNNTFVGQFQMVFDCHFRVKPEIAYVLNIENF